jgi:hypothetical protein
VASTGGKVNREEIAAIVDRFLAGRLPSDAAESSPATAQTSPETEAGSMYSLPSPRSSDRPAGASQGESRRQASGSPAVPPAATNGHKTVDFVSEDDVRRAIQKGEKIYINAKTIITPAARDIGDPAEVFAKV